MDREDICVWPDGWYCVAEDLESLMYMGKSDDYVVHAFDSFMAAVLTGAIEDGCKCKFGHEFWQILSDDRMVELLQWMGVNPPPAQTFVVKPLTSTAEIAEQEYEDACWARDEAMREQWADEEEAWNDLHGDYGYYK